MHGQNHVRHYKEYSCVSDGIHMYHLACSCYLTTHRDDTPESCRVLRKKEVPPLLNYPAVVTAVTMDWKVVRTGTE